VIKIPLYSDEGNFVTLDIIAVEEDGLVIAWYCIPDGPLTDDGNPIGSTNAVASVTNEARNIAAIMPHPERGSEAILGSDDGLVMIESFAAAVTALSV
jgi:phosphoribosylformylglycinamidine synthase